MLIDGQLLEIKPTSIMVGSVLQIAVVFRKLAPVVFLIAALDFCGDVLRRVRCSFPLPSRALAVRGCVRPLLDPILGVSSSARTDCKFPFLALSTPCSLVEVTGHEVSVHQVEVCFAWRLTWEFTKGSLEGVSHWCRNIGLFRLSGSLIGSNQKIA